MIGGSQSYLCSLCHGDSFFVLLEGVASLIICWRAGSVDRDRGSVATKPTSIDPRPPSPHDHTTTLPGIYLSGPCPRLAQQQVQDRRRERAKAMHAHSTVIPCSCLCTASHHSSTPPVVARPVPSRRLVVSSSRLRLLPSFSGFRCIWCAASGLRSDPSMVPKVGWDR